MTTQQRIDVMLAADAGKTIQKKSRLPRHYENANWRDCTVTPGWNFFAFDYRVKPEPTTKTVYRVTYKDGSRRDFDTAADAIARLEYSVFNPTVQKIEIEI